MSARGADKEGHLVRWDDARGFGFIEPDAGGRRLFAHVSAFPSGRRPVEGRPVVYVEGVDARGRPEAVQVQYVGRVPARPTPRRGVAAAVVVAATSLAGVAVLAAAGVVPYVVPLAYVVVSLVTAGAYAGDKRAAREQRWRTPESTLHLLALAGGWPGALVAQQVLRHKTVKQPFRAVFWLTVLLNVAGVVAVAGPLHSRA